MVCFAIPTYPRKLQLKNNWPTLNMKPFKCTASGHVQPIQTQMFRMKNSHHLFDNNDMANIWVNIFSIERKGWQGNRQRENRQRENKLQFFFVCVWQPKMSRNLLPLTSQVNLCSQKKMMIGWFFFEMFSVRNFLNRHR